MEAPYAAESDTSRDAAESMRDHVARLEGRVLAAIEKAGGATCDEVEVATGLAHQTASARVNGLMRKGRIYDSGERRKTRSGRNAAVWRVSRQPVPRSPEAGLSTLKRIHVNQHVIRSNEKNKTHEPVFTVKYRKQTLVGSALQIEGPSTVVYRPSQPLSCGARAWIETHGAVVIDGVRYV